VVIDPRYRGAGIAADFLRAVLLRCETPYVEMMTSMGAASKFWERAGFVDYGPSKFAKNHKLDKHNDVYGTMYNRNHTSTEVKTQTKLSTMHYYLADTKKLKSELDKSTKQL
jgi:N-acetylglutamate synthase-like GNAT family acetyltransferase